MSREERSSRYERRLKAMQDLLGVPSVYRIIRTGMQYTNVNGKFIPISDSAIYQVWITTDKWILVTVAQRSVPVAGQYVTKGLFRADRWGYGWSSINETTKKFFSDLWLSGQEDLQRTVRYYQRPGEGNRRRTLEDYWDWRGGLHGYPPARQFAQREYARRHPEIRRRCG